jgi:hypothetical protein
MASERLDQATMRLETARMTNFRACRDIAVHFNEHVTLLVGENDAGRARSWMRCAQQRLQPPSGGPCGSTQSGI